MRLRGIVSARKGAAASSKTVCGAAQLLALVLSSTSAIAQDKSPFAVRFWTLDSETRFFSWTGNRGSDPLVDAPGKGQQVYSSANLRVVGRAYDAIKFDLRARGGWTDTRQFTLGTAGGLSTLLDSQVQGTFTYLSNSGIQPFVSIALNLPTGTSQLGLTSRFARLDADLVDISSFGQGLNVNPTFGLMFLPDDEWIISTSLGPNWRGRYTKEQITTVFPIPGTPSLSSTQVNPGDQIAANVSVSWDRGPWSVYGTFAYTWEGATTRDGRDYSRSGQLYSTYLNASYMWSKAWISSLTGTWTYRARNSFLLQPAPPGPALAFGVEPKNTNSNVYSLLYEHTWSDARWSVTGLAGYLYRDRNFYDPAEDRFAAAKDRILVGSNVKFSLTKSCTVNFGASYFWIHEGPTEPEFLATPAIRQEGFSVYTGVRIKG